MKRALWGVVCLCVCAAVASAQTLYQTSYQGYNPVTGAFNGNFPIAYNLPNPNVSGPGPYPVFIWTPGTFEFYADPLGLFVIGEMAARGFIAATVAYANEEAVSLCSIYQPRTQGVFQSSNPNSAANTLCSMSNANCSAANNGGIVTMGASQGAFLAVMANNYNPAVQATYALSLGDYSPDDDVSYPCVDKENTTIPGDRLTVIDGASDQIFYPAQPQLQNITGFTCANGATQCWSPDGSGAGWYIVQNSQVEDGDAGHCYFIYDPNSNCIGVGDPSWLPPATYNWSVDPNLAWLATFGTQRVFSSTGY
jgi:hypothetical protein